MPEQPPRPRRPLTSPPWIFAVLSLIWNVVLLVILLWQSYGSAGSSWLQLIVEWTILVLVSFGGFVVLGMMANGDIDLSTLLTEKQGTGPAVASFSRFQFLIFTFVISLGLFLVIVTHPGGPQFPEKIPTEILTLLGISASTYAVGKGIQASSSNQ